MKSLVSLVLVFLCMAFSARADVNVLTQHNDNSRTGANLQEKTLTTTNVNVAHFGKLFSRNVDGQIYAQPLYVAHLMIPGKGTHNVVFVATEHNSVYAFDADDPKQDTPLWQVNLGPSCPASDFYTPPSTDMNEEVGITSTPVIDLKSETIYVETKTKENATYHQYLHALDLISGKEKPGSPVEITATVAGTGDGTANGQIVFDPRIELQRPALLLSQSVIYVAFGSHGDQGPYHGWIMGYDAKTLKQVSILNTTPNGVGGSIWQSGQGMAADDQGNLYALIANGTSDAQTGGADYSECILRLTPAAPTLQIADWFMASNADDLNANDLDFGSGGPLLMPGTDFVLGGSKQGVMYVAQQGNLGHFHARKDSQIVQTFNAGKGHMHGAPVFWNSPTHSPLIYIWTENEPLKAFALVNGKFRTRPISKGTLTLPRGMPGGFLAISADGSKPGTGIVWASHPIASDANWNTVDGLLQAYDASDLSHELWNSQQDAGRDSLGKFAKFCPPTVANGKVYLATFSRQLVVYGLLAKPMSSPQ